MENDINYLFNDVPLYSKIEIEIFNISDSEKKLYTYDEQKFMEVSNLVGFNSTKLISYCDKCKEKFPFDITEFNIIDNDGTSVDSTLYISKNTFSAPIDVFSAQIDPKNGQLWGSVGPYSINDFVSNRTWHIRYKFTCTNNSEHVYYMYVNLTFDKTKFIIEKIGQFQSVLTLSNINVNAVRDTLKSLGSFEDYIKAEMSYAHGFAIGAYAYLRRVFEKLLNFYLFEYSIDTNDDRIQTKIEAAKEYFDEDISSSLKNLYGILSKGIHELDDELCQKYYTYLKVVIDTEIEHIKNERRKKEMLKANKNIIDEIVRINKK